MMKRRPERFLVFPSWELAPFMPKELKDRSNEGHMGGLKRNASSRMNLLSRHKPTWKLALLVTMIVVTVSVAPFFGELSFLRGSYLEGKVVLSRWHEGIMNFTKIFQATSQSTSTLNSSTLHQTTIDFDNPGTVNMAKEMLSGNHEYEIFACDRSEFHADVCTIRGRVQMDANASSFLLFASNTSTRLGEESIRPYSRKWEKSVMDTIHEITIRSVNVSAVDAAQLECQVYHMVPCVVFSTGGYTGNVYHEFNDGIIPLFITSQHLKGEVVFVMVDFHNWWMSKYYEIVKQLSNYPVINFDNETRKHCFPEASLGLFYHSDLAIDPTLMPHHETVKKFRGMLGQAYSPESKKLQFTSSGKPRLVLIVRDNNRVILNEDQIVDLARLVGFEVLVWRPDRTTMLKTTFEILNSSHAVMGVHGAALTHFLFMRPGSVFIQIIPLGTDWAAWTYFGEPSIKFGLQYIEYKVTPQESTLSSKYGENDTVLTNPKAIVKQGWWATKEIYLEGQDVQLSLPRMQETLFRAKYKALAFMKAQNDIR